MSLAWSLREDSQGDLHYIERVVKDGAFSVAPRPDLDLDVLLLPDSAVLRYIENK